MDVLAFLALLWPCLCMPKPLNRQECLHKIAMAPSVSLKAGALDKLEAFSSINGARYYGLEPSKEDIELRKEDWIVPRTYPFHNSALVPLKGGETLNWKVSA